MNLYEIDHSKCTDCLQCLQVCPVHALRVGKDQLTIDETRCVHCGLCREECPAGAIDAAGERSAVQRLLDDRRKVILSMDPVCLGALPEGVTLEHIAAAALELGIWDTADASEAYSAAAREYASVIASREKDNVIMTACPVVRALAERHYPGALKYFAPIATPMILHGRMLKKDFTSASVVYVTPCAAHMDEHRDVRHSTEVNAVLSLSELLGWMKEKGIDPAACEEEPLLSDEGGRGALSAAAGGLTDCVKDYLSEAAPGEEKRWNFISVSGIEHCAKLLEVMARGEVKGVAAELNACVGGCIGVLPEAADIAPCTAELKIRTLCGTAEPADIDTSRVVLSHPMLDYGVGPYAPSDTEIDAILDRMGLTADNMPEKCGACGYASCRERAAAVLQERRIPTVCAEVLRQMRQQTDRMVVDSLPMAVLLVDEMQQIARFNKEAASLLGLKKDQEKYIFELMDPGDLQYVQGTGIQVLNKKVDFPELYLRGRVDYIPMKGTGNVLVLIEDISAQEQEEEKALAKRLETIDMAQHVIEKQMTVAQQIAFLLGETTAETKVTLNELKRRILNEEEPS